MTRLTEPARPPRLTVAQRLAAPATAPEPAAASGKSPRTDIQALRAIAVLAVVLGHLWPESIPGGFIGVDVFFVISGFLITGHLLRDSERNGRVELGNFWVRRIRRLLPASLLVLIVALVLTLLWVPGSLLRGYLQEIGGAALYAVNWVLAAGAVDYFAQDRAPSPVQHYWSLAVEEQFYLIWPLLLLAALWIAARLGRGIPARKVFGIVVIVLAAASLATSIVWTGLSPASAYFATPTRAWEFAAGALLAVFAPQLARLQIAPIWTGILGWSGLAAIAAAIVLFGPGTPFPGWAALLPVAGTALVIAVGSLRSRGGPGRLLAVRPFQVLGDISYSLYLWHWVPLALLPFALHRQLDVVDKLLILAVTLVLAWNTKRFVEDPLRRDGPRFHPRPREVFAATAVTALLLGGGPLAAYATMERNAQIQLAAAAEQAASAAEQESAACAAGFGDFEACGPTERGTPVALLPDPSVAGEDGPEDECRAGQKSPGVLVCHPVEGRGSDPTRVALLGDSHAQQWMGALSALAKDRGWALDTFMKSACPISTVMTTDEAEYTHGSCPTWNSRMIDKLEAGDYDIVLVTQIHGWEFDGRDGESSEDAGTRGVLEAWERIREATGDADLIALRDNPWMPVDIPACLGEHAADRDLGVAACSAPRDEVLGFDPLVTAAEEGDVPLIDLTAHYCDEERCYAANGPFVIYRDRNHLTATYIRTISDDFERQFDLAVATAAPTGR